MKNQESGNEPREAPLLGKENSWTQRETAEEGVVGAAKRSKRRLSGVSACRNATSNRGCKKKKKGEQQVTVSSLILQKERQWEGQT